ncbi:hypothetical protein [Myroides injenensis]|uniref:hypothetical protein n=1 Tax=Myroides injenensis TaxID=1183151 RepID=UPI0002888787|nr:hypothetical protein [Myroides injenensis]
MKKILLFCLAILPLISTSCSSDDNSIENPTPVVPENPLIGTWKVETVKFTKFVETGIPANDGCMIEGIVGYNFTKDKTFVFITGEGSSFDPTAKKYWEWKGDEKGFEINQINPSSPPYNFGIKPTNVKITEVGGLYSMTFSAKLANGSEADYKLVKGTVDNKTLPKVTLPNGDDFSCELFNQPKSLKYMLENNTWILEKGQKVFQGNFTDQPSQADRAKSMLAFSFLKDGKSLLKYTFPMGIVGAKNDTWQYNEKENSFTTNYFTEGMMGNDLRFSIKIAKIDDTKLEFTFSDDKGTNEKRIFTKSKIFYDTVEKFDNDDALTANLKDILETGKKE